MWKLTPLGRKTSSSTQRSNRNKVLDVLHSLKNASTAEIVLNCGGENEKWRVRSDLRRLEKSGLVESVGG